jgi:protein N-terminal methyltransferase
MYVFSGFVLDKVDNSVTRSDPYFRELFKRCGLYILSVKASIQKC